MKPGIAPAGKDSDNRNGENSMKFIKNIIDTIRYTPEWENIFNILILGFLFGTGFSIAFKIIV